MRELRVTAWTALLLLAVPTVASAAMAREFEFRGIVTGFDRSSIQVFTHGNVVSIPRGWLPDSVDLHPGLRIRVSRPIADLRKVSSVRGFPRR